MTHGKVCREKSTATQSLENGDERREGNSLPEDSATSFSRDATGVEGDIHLLNPVTNNGTETSRRPAQTSAKRPLSTHSGCCPPLKKVRLEEFIPSSQVIDYEKRDRYEVKLSSFAEGTTLRQVSDVCKGALQIRTGFHGENLAWAFARFASQEEAASTARTLQGTVLNGARIRVTYCGDKWKNPQRPPRYLYDTLDVQQLPRKHRTAATVATLFPTGRVIMVTNTGHAKVKFRSGAELVAAVRRRECQVVEGQKLKFALAVNFRKDPTGSEEEDENAR
ncbi:uncharacterized protein LOC142771555 [Rhipicephalus microplus]|uniref:uncharacterized protein LOC142771555 n=1 Tax=Rhipicephalus microplus TaxID=6941 RepID=UPI003F6CA8ED